MQNFKKFIIFVSTVAALMLPSTLAFAAEDEPREVETELWGQEIETPDFVLETISELQQNKSSDRVVYFPQPYAEVVDSIDVAAYRDRYFTGRSAPEPLVLQMDCDTISFMGRCTEEGATDLLVCHIVDATTNEDLPDCSLSFVADGSVTTIVWPMPQGRYKIYFVGDADIEKAEAIAVFSKFDTSIISLSESDSADIEMTEILSDTELVENPSDIE